MKQPLLAFSRRVKALLLVTKRPVVLVLLSLVMTGTIGFLDYLAGYEVSLAILYVFPIALVSWTVGMSAGIAISIISSVAQYIGDEVARPPYIQPFMPFWRAIAAVCFYLLLVWLVVARKQAERRQAELMTQLQDSTVLEERNRMAGEIHDTLAQGFTGILVQLEAARDTITSSPEEATKHVERARDLARASLGEARRSVWSLRPLELEAEGLVDAVQHFLDRIAAGGPTAVTFSLQGIPYPLPSGVAQGLLRVCQEAVVNALRHAKASRVLVYIMFDPSEVKLFVQDNGLGFDPGSRETGKGFGLTIMRERAERIGAQLEVHSEPGAGTRVIMAVRAPAQGWEGRTR